MGSDDRSKQERSIVCDCAWPVCFMFDAMMLAVSHTHSHHICRDVRALRCKLSALFVFVLSVMSRVCECVCAVVLVCVLVSESV